MSLSIKSKSFSQLTTEELYDILKLRSEVFVIEQNCIYQDIDSKDLQALHFIGTIENEFIAYARCFAPGIYFEEAAIGRVLIKENFRNRGYAHLLMKNCISQIENAYHTSVIKIGAQKYLIEFYEKHGFQPIGEEYLEDGIPHINMIRK